MEFHSPADLGVSKVLGVILIVALTVVLGSVVGLTAFSFSPDEPIPNASYKVTINHSNDTIKLTQVAGDSIDTDYIELVINGEVMEMKSEYDGQELSNINPIEYHLPADFDTSDTALVRYKRDGTQGIVAQDIEIKLE